MILFPVLQDYRNNYDNLDAFVKREVENGDSKTGGKRVKLEKAKIVANVGTDFFEVIRTRL